MVLLLVGRVVVDGDAIDALGVQGQRLFDYIEGSLEGFSFCIGKCGILLTMPQRGVGLWPLLHGHLQASWLLLSIIECLS